MEGLAAPLRFDGSPDVDGRRASVCSLRREGQDLASWLIGHGADVTMCDSRTDAQLAAASEAPPGVGRVMTGQPFPDPDGLDLIGVSQSVLATDAVVSRARVLGIPVISPMQLFLRFARPDHPSHVRRRAILPSTRIRVPRYPPPSR